MKNGIRNHFLNIILPALVLAAVTGAVTGALIFAFRLITEEIIHLSAKVFAFAGANPWAIPLVVAGAVLAALLVSVSLLYSPHSRGGGIPTAVALMRGLITFHWLRNIIFVFTSGLLSYLFGIPLGNDEGPAVQMGTAVGSAVSRADRKHGRGWERFMMTGGATAGFAVATCAPISAILFALEEVHRRITPLLLMTSATAVLSGMGALRALCHLTGHSELLSLFHFHLSETMELHRAWIAVLVGVLCGVGACLLAFVTLKLRAFMHKRLHRIHPFFKVAPIFAVVALIGCFFYEHHVIGTGHHLIDALIQHRELWYISLVLLAVRAVLVILSHDVGITGGLFTPLLVFGALIGSMSAELLISLGWMDERLFPVVVVLGMAGFFSGSVRTPLTAAVFCIEVFDGFANILPMMITILVSYVIVETLGVISINEIAMEREVHRAHRGKSRRQVDVKLYVKPGCFAVGKEPRDILWPPTCQVLSMLDDDLDETDSYTGGALRAGMILRLNFSTYDPEETAALLCGILGEQDVYGNAVILDEQVGPRLSESIPKREN